MLRRRDSVVELSKKVDTAVELVLRRATMLVLALAAREVIAA